MSDAPVVSIEGLGKKYAIGQHNSRRYVALRDVIAERAQAIFTRKINGAASAQDLKEFWALQNVSLDVHGGERIGILGRNGAGKSTLLKILSRITEPTTGRVKIVGRIGSLLEVGTGFHPELTGRENIYLNGAILGMSRSETRRKFDEIVAFAEVQNFLDTPVKRYSSGMYVRLAFAVAAHLQPDILIVDEVLAVGDLSFQRKSLQRMRDITDSGITVLFVSHDMSAISSLCNRAVLLEQGRIIQTGATDDVIKFYQDQLTTNSEQDLSQRHDRRGEGGIRLQKIEFLDCTGKGLVSAVSGETIIVAIEYEAFHLFSAIDFAVSFRTLTGTPLFICTATNDSGPFSVQPGRGRVYCVINNLPLADGSFSLNVAAQNGSIMYDWVERAAVLNVASLDYYGNGNVSAKQHSPILVKSAWRLDS